MSANGTFLASEATERNALGAEQMLSDKLATESQGVGPAEDLFVFGLPFWNPTYERFKAWWNETLASPERAGKRMISANAHTLNNAWNSPEFRTALSGADVRLNDGIGFRLAARMRGVDVRYNFNGTDLVPRLFSELDQPLRVFLYGASEAANARVAEWIQQKYPLVQVVGRINGYVDPDNEAAPAIAKAEADLVLIALGHPHQELFAARHGSKLNAKIIYPVGGLFDFLSGTKPRAPKMLRMASLEWMFRLALEPKRMFRRYVIGNPVFLTRCLGQAASDRRIMSTGTGKVAA